MKNTKSILIFTGSIVFALGLSYLLRKSINGKEIAVVLFALFLFLFLLHFFLRKNVKYKSFFMSKWNVFTTKYKKEDFIDISPDLLFEKFIDIIEGSTFKVSSSNKVNYEIFAITPLTMRSWGENIYIQFIESKGGSKMKFESSTLFQVTDWGKNKTNHILILDEFNKSLTI